MSTQTTDELPMFQLVKIQPITGTHYSLQDVIRMAYNMVELLGHEARVERAIITQFRVSVDDRVLAVFDEAFPDVWIMSACPALSLVLLQGYEKSKK